MSTANTNSPPTVALDILRTEFAIDVFDERKMRDFMPSDAFKKFTVLLRRGEHQIIDLPVANAVAAGMKSWAMARGATHWCHWFQPMTGETAEKQESFLSGKGSNFALTDFSGEFLVRGEPDASSFPHGGLRCTHEARGYTVWDPQSPAFIRHNKLGGVLYIPSAFASWTGDALDFKMPLLKAEEVLGREALRTLRLLGDSETSRVFTTLGCEQEFFVVDRSKYLARPDLVLAGRSVLGARPPKGQELEDQYFGAISSRVLGFVAEAETRLWRLGIPAKTRHNEVAPGQFEIAPVFEPSSVAVDHQMLTMQVLTETAREHGLEVLLHEKPFAYVNGSGKHNNWSLCTDTGINLFDPEFDLKSAGTLAFEGLENARFTVFLAAFLKAFDEFADSLRSAVASHGNDWRLGANEAPPGIISVFLGDVLTAFVDGVIKIDELPVNGGLLSPKSIRERNLQLIAARPDCLNFAGLPTLRRDRTDRNRTSPCAFTGNKFEFRAVGSSANSAVAVTALNAAMALALRAMNDEAERLVKSSQASAFEALRRVTIDALKNHYRVIFDGNGYSVDWVIEASRRGLCNFRNTVEALEKADLKRLYVPAGVFSEREIDSRVNVALDDFVKNVAIELRCLLHISTCFILPVVETNLSRVATLLHTLAALGGSVTSSGLVGQGGLPGFKSRVDRLMFLGESLITKTEELRLFLEEEKDDLLEEAKNMQYQGRRLMQEIREICDAVEVNVDKKTFPLPTYYDLLFAL